MNPDNGNLIVQFEIEFPTKVQIDKKALLEEILGQTSSLSSNINSDNKRLMSPLPTNYESNNGNSRRENVQCAQQ